MVLSIVIPTKNEEKYLPALLESIKKQTFTNYEVIVADNNSKDKTRIIAKKFNCRLIKGGLPGKARNAGAKSAKGEIILFLDADTKLRSKNFLKNSITEFDKRNLDIAVPATYVRGGKLDKIYYDFWNQLVKFFQYTTPFAGGWCIFIRKELHKKIGGFNEKIMLGEDSDYAKRASKEGKFRILKSSKIETSTRRLKKEGYLKVALQSIGAGIYWALEGKIDDKNKFNYKFDIYEK